MHGHRRERHEPTFIGVDTARLFISASLSFVIVIERYRDALLKKHYFLLNLASHISSLSALSARLTLEWKVDAGSSATIRMCLRDCARMFSDNVRLSTLQAERATARREEARSGTISGEGLRGARNSGERLHAGVPDRQVGGGR